MATVENSRKTSNNDPVGPYPVSRHVSCLTSVSTPSSTMIVAVAAQPYLEEKTIVKESNPTGIADRDGTARSSMDISRPFRVFGALILALAIVGATNAAVLSAPSVPATSADPSFVTASGYCADAEERYFLKLINDYRAQNGRGPLRLTKTLGAAAEHHSVDMASKNYFSHTLSGGVTWSQNITNHGYTYNTYKAENIAAGSSMSTQTFNQWKNSSGHRANMLSANFKAIGIGRAYGSASSYKWYWTTTFGGYQDAAFTCRA